MSIQTLTPTKPALPFVSLSHSPLPPSRRPLDKPPRPFYREKQKPWVSQRTHDDPTKANFAATMVACAWRGYFCRRELRKQRLTELYKTRKYIVVQCFFRAVKARMTLKWRRQLREMDSAARTSRYIDLVLQQVVDRLGWQRHAMERAAIVVQRAVRWLISKIRKTWNGSPLPLVNPRRRFLCKTVVRTKSGNVVQSSESRALVPRGSLVVARLAQPLSPDEVEAENAKNRQLTMYKAHLRAEQSDKISCKRGAILNQNLHECAAIVQRQYRCYMAKFTLSSRLHLMEYLTKYVCVLQRSIRNHFAVKRFNKRKMATLGRYKAINKKYHEQQMLRLRDAIQWDRFTLERGAVIVQKAWRYCSGPHEARAPPYTALLVGTRSPQRRARPPDESKDESNPTNNTETVEGTKPAADAQPAESTKPAADVQPAEAKPAESTEAPADAKPTEAKPAESTKPAADAQPAESTKPPADVQPAESTKPPADAQPAESTKPAADAKPAESTKPPADVQPAESTKPAADAKPAESAKAPADAKPVEAKPAESTKPAPDAQPAEAKPAESAKAPADAQPAESTKPAADAKPTESTKPAENTKPAADAKPAESTKPPADVQPAESTKPAADAKPAESAKAPADAKPAESTKPAADAKPAEAKGL